MRLKKAMLMAMLVLGTAGLFCSDKTSAMRAGARNYTCKAKISVSVDGKEFTLSSRGEFREVKEEIEGFMNRKSIQIQAENMQDIFDNMHDIFAGGLEDYYQDNWDYGF